jgi:sigma-E factor negative regulatory protein RseC
MVSENGRVVAVTGDSIWVETIRQSTCDSCNASKACGQGVLNKIYDGQRHHIEIKLDENSPADIKVDDEVEICVPEQTLLLGSFLVYLLPLLGLLIGGFLGQSLADAANEAAVVTGAVAGFIAGMLVARSGAATYSAKEGNRPRLLAVLPGRNRGQVETTLI